MDQRMELRGAKRRKLNLTPSSGSSQPQSEINDTSQELNVKKAISVLTGRTLKRNDILIALKTIECVSKLEGLSPWAIKTLVNILNDYKYNFSTRRKLIISLVPKSSVPEMAVIVATRYLTLDSFDIRLKVFIVKWILIIYHLMDSCEKYQHLYSMLFVLLESDSMRPYICDLLHRMTTKEKVIPYRIRDLMDLYSRVGPEKHLLALLQAYSEHRPDLVYANCSYKKAFGNLGKFAELVNKINRPLPQQVESQPPISESNAVSEYRQLKITLESLKEGSGFLKFLQSDQRRLLITSAVSKDPLLALSLFLCNKLCGESSAFPKRSTPKKLKQEDPFTREKLLPIISEISFELQEGVPNAFHFITEYIKTWDGITYSKFIFDMIPYWELCLLEDMLEILLNPIFKHFVLSPILFKCQFICALSMLYQNWLLIEMPRVVNDTKQLVSLEKKDVISDPKKQINRLADYVDRVCLAALQCHPTHPPLLLYEILNSWTLMTEAHSGRIDINLPLPSVEVMCAAAISPCINILEQMCRLLDRYKTQIQSMKAKTNCEEVEESVDDLLVSACKMLWPVNSGVPHRLQNTFFTLCLPPNPLKVITDPWKCFNIYKHPALIHLYKIFLLKHGIDRHLEFGDDETDAYLQQIKIWGMAGIKEFIDEFIIIFRN